MSPSRNSLPVSYTHLDSWYLERRIYVTVGVNITLGSILFLLHSPWWGPVSYTHLQTNALSS